MTIAELIAKKDEALQEAAAAQTPEEVEQVRIKYLGRNGLLPAIVKGFKDVPKEDRPAFGKITNQWRQELEAALAGKKADGDTAATGPAFDPSLPGRWFVPGSKNPISRVMEETAAIFSPLGFSVADGPDIETKFNNFTALNTPAHHPSMDPTDTLWLTDELLLRTQTSPVQIRTMTANKPPVRIITPGRTYRRDTTDATHSANFHQIEGLYVDVKPVSLADLKSTLTYYAQEMMGPRCKAIRFRPHFFPFTEPSVEVDFQCHVCGGKGCRVCKNSGWIEVAGAGLVDPRVYRFVGYDPDQVWGFAFGMGVERIAMIKYGIPDIRWLYENDVRFLDQVK